MEKIQVLFCNEKSLYKTLRGRNRVHLCDVYDKKRNALTCEIKGAAIYHPPCRLWSRLRAFSTADENEKYLAVWSVNKVRSYGGILEHPAQSSLWACMKLPAVGQSDEFGFTIEVDQFHFGHKYRKRTWLYICGASPADLPLEFRRIPGEPKYSIGGENEADSRFYREYTPKKFAKWLVKICAQINNLKAEKSLNLINGREQEKIYA
ncbi:MAG: hypothetical protein ACXVP0_13255 [Bacteroidia bacterium]